MNRAHDNGKKNADTLLPWPEQRARGEVSPVRTVQANPKSDKKLSRPRAETQKNPPVDMANVGLVALVALFVGPGKGYFSFLENGLMPEEPVDPKVLLRHDRKGA